MDRLLDGLERRFWLLGRGVSVNVAAIARVRGPLREADVRGALDAVQARHPRLGVRIDEGPPARFVSGTPAIPLRVVARARDGGWRAAAEDDLAERFPPSPGPLLRATLVGGAEASELILVCHHVLGDGTALFALVAEVLRVATGEPPGPPLGEEGPLSAICPRSARGIAGQVGFQREAQRLAVEAKRVRPKALRRDVDAPAVQRRSRIVQRVLGAPETAALAARAMRQRTTVQGALSAAALQAVRADAGRPLGLGCHHAVDLRADLERPVREAFGLYAVGVPTYHRVDVQAFWDLARETRTALGTLLQRRVPLLTAAHLEATMPRDAAAARDLVEQADHLDLVAVAVTGLHDLSSPVLPGLEWEAFQFAGAVGIGNVLFVAATTFRGSLTLDFVTAEPLVAPARAEQLADRTMEILAAAP